MLMAILSLCRLPLHTRARVTAFCGPPSLGNRLLDLGLTEGTPVHGILNGPSGDPVAYAFRNTVVALRGSDAACVMVEPVTEP